MRSLVPMPLLCYVFRHATMGPLSMSSISVRRAVFGRATWHPVGSCAALSPSPPPWQIARASQGAFKAAPLMHPQDLSAFSTLRLTTVNA